MRRMGLLAFHHQTSPRCHSGKRLKTNQETNVYKKLGATSERVAFRPTLIARCVALTLAATGCAGAFAFELETGNSDLKLSWDNTVRYNAGWRMGKIAPAFYNDPGFDETEGRFGRGDMVTNRVDLLTEFDAVWRNDYGFRVSAAGWFDEAYDKKSRQNPMFGGFSGNYAGDNFNSYAKRYVRGPSGEVLDAFAFGKFQFGSTQLNLKIGQHNVYWGDSLFSIGNSIAYSQGPIDTIKAATSPGAEAKELFMPLNQISAQLQVTPEVSIGAQYLLDWKPFRLVPGGTFFAPADGARSDYATPPAYAAFNAFLDNGPDLEPNKKRGDFGLNLRVSPSWLNGTLGVYYRRFDEKLPWAFLHAGGGTTPGTVGAIRLNYARNTELLGVSLNKSLGPISVGSELSHRKNTALNSTSGYLVIPTGPQVSYEQAEGARGDTFHALVNGVYLLPRTPLWVGGSLVAELSYQRLSRVTKNQALFNACNGADKRTGCASKDAWSMNVGFTPEWPQAYPGWDLSMPVSLAYGIKGNGPALAGGYEGAVTWSIGLAGKLYQKYEFSLKYIDSYARYSDTLHASGQQAVQNNHNWLSFTFKTTF